jgi:heterodisulfide reductase subunit A
LFQETLINAGLNKYLVEMANIRNHDSWVHSNDPDAATQKAKDLVHMAVAKAALANPLVETDLAVDRSALVVGGGVAGMTTSLALARQGCAVHLVEKSDHLGGNALRLHSNDRGESIADFLKDLITRVETDKRIQVHLETTIGNVDGFVGNFETMLINESSSKTVKHGVTILATGAKESRPKDYLYGEHKAVVTHLELDDMFKHDDPRIRSAHVAVFIQCVGSRNEEHPYCSKVCCTHSVKSALELKKRRPDMNVYILCRDIRTYGEREGLYQKARAAGVLFSRYTQEKKPVAEPLDNQVAVTFYDPILGRWLSVNADILCLAAAIVSHQDQALVQKFKVTMDSDGWLLEAHQKLRPVDCSNDGIFLCGMAHYPKPVEESIVQARAAASRALTVLAREHIRVGGIVAQIAPELCSGCLGCVNVCPFAAITFDAERKVAEVNEALCKGCGACAAACPSEASVLMGFNNKQLYAQIESALSA